MMRGVEEERGRQMRGAEEREERGREERRGVNDKGNSHLKHNHTAAQHAHTLVPTLGDAAKRS